MITDRAGLDKVCRGDAGATVYLDDVRLPSIAEPVGCSGQVAERDRRQFTARVRIVSGRGEWNTHEGWK